MLEWLSKEDFKSAYINLDNEIVIEFDDETDDSSGSTYRFINFQTYKYSVELIQELDEKYGFEITEDESDWLDFHSIDNI